MSDDKKPPHVHHDHKFNPHHTPMMNAIEQARTFIDHLNPSATNPLWHPVPTPAPRVFVETPVPVPTPPVPVPAITPPVTVPLSYFKDHPLPEGVKPSKPDVPDARPKGNGNQNHR